MSSNITPIHRPPVGVWPPCPPVIPCPPMPCPPQDCFGLSSLEKCYADVKRAQEFLTQMIKDIIACDPSIIGSGAPIVGVTDGSDALPGMVGEWLHFSILTPVTVPAGGAAATYNVAMGSLPAGDWDVWAYFYQEFGNLDNLDMYFNPLPDGWSGNGYAALSTGGNAWVSMAATTVRALTSVPTLIALTVIMSSTPGASGSINTQVTCRRRR